MPITTSGFTPRSGVLPTFTPVDPRLAVADPVALMNGITSGMAFQRGIIADQNFRQISPLQQQLAMAQAQQNIANLPQLEQERKWKFDAAQRADTLAKMQPIPVGGKIREIDENGNEVEWQPTSDLNPATGLPWEPGTKPAHEVSIISTAAQRDLKDRSAEALALSREAQAERNFALATGKPIIKNKVQKLYDYRNNKVFFQAIGDDGQPAGKPWLAVDDKGEPIPPPPQKDSYGAVIDFGDKAKTGTDTGTDTGVTTGKTGVASRADWESNPTQPTPDIQSQGAVPAMPDVEFMQDVEFIPPEYSFDNDEEVMMAARLGYLKPGQAILVGGRRAHWQKSPGQ